MKTLIYFTFVSIGLALAGCDNRDLAQIGNIPNNQSGIVNFTPAKLALSEVVHDYGASPIGTINNAVVTVTNLGTETATNVSASSFPTGFHFEGGTYPGLGGTCTDTIPAGACTLVVAFAPTSIASYSGQVSLNYIGNKVMQKATIGMTGTGVNIAILRLSMDNKNAATSAYDFGMQASGTTVNTTVYVLYTGAVAATGVSFSGVTAPFSISKNTCAINISASGCSFNLSYVANSNAAQQIKLTWNNSAFVDQTTLDITGEVKPVTAQPVPAVLTINNGQAISFSKQLINHPYDMTVPLSTNIASFSATNITPVAFTSSAFNYKGGAYPGTGGTCTATLASASSCNLVLTFNPPAATNYTDTLAFKYSNGAANNVSASQSLSGPGGNPAVLTLSDSSYNFGTNSLNYTTSKTFSLNNATATNVTGVSIAFSALSSPFSYSSNNCGSTLAPASSCTFTVNFSPKTAASFSSTITVTYGSGDSSQTPAPLTLALSGQGSTAAKITVSNYNFGAVVIGNVVTGDVTLNYYGSDPVTNLVVSGLQKPPFDQVAASNSACGATITASCNIGFSFTPNAAQSFTDALTLSFVSAGVNTSIFMSLIGTGLTPAVLAFDATAYDFGAVVIGSGASHTFTLTNSGSANATSITYSSLSAPFSKGSPLTCSNSNQTTCSFTVNFNPTTAVVPNQTITVNYNNGTSTPPAAVTLTLSGSGSPLALLSNGNASFGKVAVNTTSGSQTVQITNSGSGGASALSVSAPSAPFNLIKDGCGNALAAGASCLMTYGFSPKAAGNMSQALTIKYSDGVNNKTLSASLSGAGTVPVQLAANGDHSCVRTDLGQITCWGHNNVGQLGAGDTVDRGGMSGQMGNNLPIVNLGSAYTYGVAKVVAGYWHNCALLVDGNVKCFGANFSGQLGLGDLVNRGDVASNMGDNLPLVDLGSGRTAVDLSAGYAHTCALLDNATVKCWGLNAQGQLGRGNTVNMGSDANEMGDNLAAIDLGGTPVLSISAGTGDSCAILKGGVLKCWGDNFYGQLGLGDSTNRGDRANQMGANLPVVNLGKGRTVLKVSSGGGFHCAVLDNGGLKCVGRNDAEGNLGVPLWCQDAGANAAPCGGSYTYSLPGFGTTLLQIGDNNPYLNLGTGRKVVDIQSGQDFSCAILDNNSVKCFGNNDYGQLGHGNTTDQGAGTNDMGDNLMVTPLSSKLGTSMLSLGATFACAQLTDGSIKCWGDNRSGQLGAGNLNPIGTLPNQMGDNLATVNW